MYQGSLIIGLRVGVQEAGTGHLEGVVFLPEEEVTVTPLLVAVTVPQVVSSLLALRIRLRDITINPLAGTKTNIGITTVDLQVEVEEAPPPAGQIQHRRAHPLQAG